MHVRLQSSRSKDHISDPQNPPDELINEETVSALKDEIGYLWEVYRIEPYYREAFWTSLAGLPAPIFVQRLAKEIEELYKEKSPVQRLFAAIRRREELFCQVEKLNNDLVQGSTDAGGKLTDAV